MVQRILPLVSGELINFGDEVYRIANSNSRAVYGKGLWLIAYTDCGFESRQGYGRLSLVSVCCQVEVSASGRSPVQRSPTDCGLCHCV